MYRLTTNFTPENEIEEEVCPFEPFLNGDIEIVHTAINKDGKNVLNTVKLPDKEYSFTNIITSKEDIAVKREYKRMCRHAVYSALSDYTGRKMPWGSLTGIRPTKLAYEYLAFGGNKEHIAEYLSKNFDILPKKAKIIQNIVLCQAQYYCISPDFVNLYVHIPFCPTKCTYCAFVTHLVDKCKDIIPLYTRLLVKEIEQSIRLIHRNGQKIYSIYVGGGTPSALPDEQFEEVLSALSGHNVEFTCEAGRPDSITPDKAAIMKRCGVSRVCVNPQTLNESTLTAIGRRHSAQDFIDSYKLMRDAGFDINVDLIAGLEGENSADFMYSLKKVEALQPQNITVHTLSVKNGSFLKNNGDDVYNSYTSEMVEKAYEFLLSSGYAPYYLYRQKHMLDNLENIGYSLPGKICVNNVTTMEETLSVIACGAGAISKRIFPQGRIERLANLRDAKLYIDQFDERLEKKLKFFEK